MKKLIILIMFVFLTGCTASQQGALLGGLTGMAGSAVGKGDRKTTAIAGAVGAATGYMIGNEIDKQNTPASVNTNNGQTDCEKVVIRKTVNGITTETIEEVCKGNKTLNTY